jgi:hypothetical protein
MMNRSLFKLVGLSLFVASTMIAGCSGGDDSGGTTSSGDMTTAGSGGSSGTTTGTTTGSGGSGAVADQIACMQTIVGKTCGNAGCHGKEPANGLILTAESVQDGSKFIDKAGQGTADDKSCGMGGYKWINKAMPEQSLIYTKVSTTAPCGQPMPQAGTRLNTTQKKCVLDWINYSIANAK